MATVRITNAMRVDVKSKLRSMYDKKIEAVKKEALALDIADELYTHIMGGRSPSDVKATLNNLPLVKTPSSVPVHWVYYTDGMSIRNIFDMEDGTYIFNGDYKFKNDASYPMPFENVNHWGVTMPQYELPETHSQYSKLKELVIYMDVLNKEFTRLHNELVLGAMERCTTIKQLLEVWPSALDFLDASVRERHNRVEPRSKAAKPAITISDEAKTALIKVRLTYN